MKNRRRSWMPRFAPVLVAALFALFACRGAVVRAGEGSEAVAPIRFGLIDTLTGDDSHVSRNIMRGVTHALEEINRAGGVLGRPLEVGVWKTDADSDVAMQAFREIAADPGFVAVIGPMRTMIVEPMPKAETEALRIPMILPIASKDGLLEDTRYRIRVITADRRPVQLFSNYLGEKLGVKRPAVVHLVSDASSVYVAELFRRSWDGVGVELVADIAMAESNTPADWARQCDEVAAQLKAVNPDFIYVSMPNRRLAALIRAVGRLEIPARFGGGDVWDSPVVWLGSGRGVAGALFMAIHPPQGENAVGDALIEAFRRRDLPHDGNVTMAYDAVRLLADAIARAGDADREKINAALHDVRGLDLASGRYDIGSDGEARKMLYLNVVEATPDGFRPRLAVRFHPNNHMEIVP